MFAVYSVYGALLILILNLNLIINYQLSMRNSRFSQIFIMFAFIAAIQSLHINTHQHVQHLKKYKFKESIDSLLFVHSVAVGERNDRIQHWTPFFANITLFNDSIRQIGYKNHQIQVVQNDKQFKAMIVGYNDYIILTFRYTDNSLNIVTDIDAKLVPDKTYGQLKVHRGFQELWDSGKEEVYKQLLKLQNNKKRSKLYITGYSLGGGLAQISFFQIRNLGYFSEYQILTFGSPRVGDKQWSQKFDQLTNNSSIRYVAEGDPVCNLPSYQINIPQDQLKKMRKYPITSLGGFFINSPIILDIIYKAIRKGNFDYYHAGSEYNFKIPQKNQTEGVLVENKGHQNQTNRKHVGVTQVDMNLNLGERLVLTPFRNFIKSFIQNSYDAKLRKQIAVCGFQRKNVDHFLEQDHLKKDYNVLNHQCDYYKLFQAIVQTN